VVSRLVIGWNLTKVWLLLIGFCGVLGGIGWLLGGYRPLSIFIFCGLLVAGATYWFSDRVVMGMVGAKELPLAEAPLVHSALARLAARAGVVKPRLYLMRDGHARALVAGRGARGGSALAVSTGLLAVTNPAELEGVLAHEVAHVRHRDVLVQSVAVVLAATLVELSRVGGWLERGLLFVLGHLASAFAHLLISPKREFVADRLAAQLCDSPHGLADALVRLDQAAELIEFKASPATEPLYTINPFATEGLAALFNTHPSVEERVRRLRAVDPDWREKLRAA
jgi:heat shock protein HtpX